MGDPATLDPALVRLLGPLTAAAAGDGEAPVPLRMLVQADHVDASGAVHGHVLMGFAHGLLGRCAGGLDAAAATGLRSGLSVTCDFLGTAPVGAILEGTARLTRRTRTVLFLDAEIRQIEPEPGHALVHATALWRVTAP